MFITRGTPKHIRSDNGPEFIATCLITWLRQQEVGTVYIKPGSPWENCFIERFNGTLRDELLGQYAFLNGPEAQEACETYRMEYNNHRPHSSLGYLSPAKTAEKFRGNTNTPPETSPGKRNTPGQACHVLFLPTIVSSGSQFFSTRDHSK